MRTVRNALVSYLVASTALLLTFFFLRVPLMTTRNYSKNNNEAPSRWLDSLLLSTMIQTTVGANNGLQAESDGARWIETLQAMSTFIAIGVILLLAIIAAT